jgi:hypothetical protein
MRFCERSALCIIACIANLFRATFELRITDELGSEAVTAGKVVAALVRSEERRNHGYY